MEPEPETKSILDIESNKLINISTNSKDNEVENSTSGPYEFDNNSYPVSNEFEEEALKGDAIGNTMFSGSFVLRTLMKLLSFQGFLKDDEEFEQQLCQVWDMTTDPDVIVYLHKVEIIQTLHEALLVSIDDRLTEIIIGIFGNLCSDEDVCNDIISNQVVFEYMFITASTRDTETLIQLFRLISCLLLNIIERKEVENLHTVILKTNFYDNLCEILSNSTNPQLLKEALRSLNAISKTFITYEQEEKESLVLSDNLFCENLLKASMEAMKVLMDEKDHVEEASIFFLNLHYNLITFNKGGWYPCLKALFETIDSIIRTKVNEDTLGIMEEISQVKEIIFWPEIMALFLKTFRMFCTKLESDDFFDEEDSDKYVDILELSKRIILKQVHLATQDELTITLSQNYKTKQNAEFFCRVVVIELEGSEELKSSLIKLKKVFNYDETQHIPNL